MEQIIIALLKKAQKKEATLFIFTKSGNSQGSLIVENVTKELTTFKVSSHSASRYYIPTSQIEMIGSDEEL